jgi:hypothetical protein
VTWAQFEPDVAFVDGGASVTTTNGSWSYALCSASITSAVDSLPTGRA